jgi:pimeloyl-ACP methyl ester carboxylesterase
MHDSASSELVILLHGILLNRLSMFKMQRCIAKAGFATLNIGYPSSRYPLDVLADKLHEQLSSHALSRFKAVHFVGFSMGNLLIRAYLTKYRPENLGKVVMIAPPNKGSELADYFQNWWLYKKLYGPAGQQLITRQSEFQAILGDKLDYETGIIAGSRSQGIILSRLLPKPNDGKVTVENTRMNGMKDHIILSTNHIQISRHKGVIKQTVHFLKHGLFVR